MDWLITPSLLQVGERLKTFVPAMIVSFLIVLIGLLCGWLAKTLLSSLFRLFKIDDYAERWGLRAALAKGGVQEPPSRLLGRLGGFMVLVIFLLVSVDSMGVPVLTRLTERILHYLPNIFVALLLVIVGYLFANFCARAALIAAVNSGARFPRQVSRALRAAIMTIAALIAAEHLGIGEKIVQLTFTILFSGAVLALAIAFGLGGRKLAGEFLEKKFREPREKDELDHL